MKILIFGDVSDWNIKNFSIDNIPEIFRRKIKEADLCIFNLEGPIIEKTNDYKFEISENNFWNFFWNGVLNIFKKRQPQVWSSEKILELKKLNSNICFTLANNHIKDFGEKGIVNTIRLLEENKIKYLGAGINGEDNRLLSIKIKDQEVIILNINRVGLKKWGVFANIYGHFFSNFGSAYINHTSLEKKVSSLKTNNPTAQIITIIHGGKEMPLSIESADLGLEKLERLDSNIILLHHLHKTFEYKSEKVFINGDFIFYRPGKLPNSRTGAFFEFSINKKSINFNKILYNFKDGYPFIKKK